MKIKPVVDALEARAVTVDLVHTGQHYDTMMSDVFFEDLGLRPPDHSLNVGSASHGSQTAQIMVGFETLQNELAADALVVVGDVNSTLACAIVGAKAGLFVAHVEAGLRSRDWSMPEEVNRVVSDRVSDVLFAPSADAVENLTAEGYRADQIELVGNVMIDTLLNNLERASQRSVLATLGVEGIDYGLVTLHRPSNVDDIGVLKSLLSALERVASRLPLIFPVHPRTVTNLKGLVISPRIQLVEPQGYLDFLALQANASLVLTDSGGVQEETTALGVACLTLRESTERPITIDQGTNHLVGTDPEVIVAKASSILDDGYDKRCPELWDGHAGERIAEALIERLNDSQRLHPTDHAQ
jgi:UDP-N-acetylglucosamine 2-epimerase (non-hydrolysing)